MKTKLTTIVSLFFALAVSAQSFTNGPTIVGNMLQIFGNTYSPLPYVRFIPGTNYIAQGTNTYFPVPQRANITNGLFSARVAGPTFYDLDFGPNLARIRILAPADTNTYTVNYCANLAVNAGFGFTVTNNMYVTNVITNIVSSITNTLPGSVTNITSGPTNVAPAAAHLLSNDSVTNLSTYGTLNASSISSAGDISVGGNLNTIGIFANGDINASGNAVIAENFQGGGTQLTALNGTNILPGTLIGNASKLTNMSAASMTGTVTNPIVSPSISGNGAGITNLSLPPVGNLLIVSTSGNDATGARNSTKPFLTPSAAKAAAQIGDTIVVYPGAYNDHNLLKSGVNWYFYPGATVQWFQQAGVNNTGGNCPTNDWQGIFDDRPGAGGPVTNCVIGGFGDFIFTGPGATNTIVGTNSFPFEAINTCLEFTQFSNSVTHAFPDGQTLGAVVLVNSNSSLSMTANSISTLWMNWPIGDTNSGTFPIPLGGAAQVLGTAWDIIVSNCAASYFNINELRTWSYSNSIPGYQYPVQFIEWDPAFSDVFQTDAVSGLDVQVSVNNYPTVAQMYQAFAGGIYWEQGDMHVNVDKLDIMAGTGNNGLWSNTGGVGGVPTTATVSLWANIKDMETYYYDSGIDPNYRVWLDFQQARDVQSNNGEMVLFGNGKVYIRGEKVMFPTNMGAVFVLNTAQTTAGNTNGEVWLNIQKVAFDTTPTATTNTGGIVHPGSAWIYCGTGYPKLTAANIEQFEDSGNAIGNCGGIGGDFAGIDYSVGANATNSQFHIRGQYALLGTGKARFAAIKGGTNQVIEGYNVDARLSSSVSNVISLAAGATNLTLRNMWIAAGPSTTNLVGGPANSSIGLQSVFANITNGLNVSSNIPAVHWP